MGAFVAGLLIIVAIIVAAWYILKDKKRGNKCIGCPYSDNCQAQHNPFRSHQTRY